MTAPCSEPRAGSNSTPGITNTTAATTNSIFSAGLVAILRARSTKHFPAIAETLINAGVRVIEVTLTPPGAIAAIADLTERFDGAAIIGAGTVMTADQAEACIDAGAVFVVSPAASPDVMARARIAGIAAYPGALTPTEIINAYHAGAPAVKLFPASAVPPRYVTDVHGPFPEVPLMPTGGIAIGDIATWLRAGAAAVGLGTPLIGTAASDCTDGSLAERARQALAAVAEARLGQ